MVGIEANETYTYSFDATDNMTFMVLKAETFDSAGSPGGDRGPMTPMASWWEALLPAPPPKKSKSLIFGTSYGT